MGFNKYASKLQLTNVLMNHKASIKETNDFHLIKSSCLNKEESKKGRTAGTVRHW